MQWFRGGLVFQTDILLYHSTLGARIIKKKEKLPPPAALPGLGFRVWASGFEVQGSGFRVQGSGFWVWGVGLRAQGSGFRIQGSGFRVQGGGFRVQS